jgi:hypothetical protein
VTISRSCGAKTAAAAAGEGEGGAAEEMVREQDEVIRNKEEEIKTKRRSRSASRPSSGRCSAPRSSSPPWYVLRSLGFDSNLIAVYLDSDWI